MPEALPTVKNATGVGVWYMHVIDIQTK